MTVRFLDVVESAVAGFPFMPGQEIHLPQMTPAIRAALQDGRAELVRGEEPEVATVAVNERAVARRGKRSAA